MLEFRAFLAQTLLFVELNRVDHLLQRLKFFSETFAQVGLLRNTLNLRFQAPNRLPNLTVFLLQKHGVHLSILQC